jgi:hypothetical protein
MRYRSDIRESQIRSLRDRVDAADYRKYLQEMTLHKLRAFEGARIRFRFPVTALIGPNGGGKSTILGAAALIYKSAKPSIFFAQSSADREAMRGIRVSYRLIDRDHRRDGEIERSVTHPDLKWSREALDRRLLFLASGGRCQPTNALSSLSFGWGLKKFVMRTMPPLALK